MAKIKAVKFHSDFCESGEIKFAAGKCYPKNAETDRCVALNFGDVVSVDEKLVTDPQQEIASTEQSEAERIAAEKAAAEQAEAERIAAEQAAAKLKLEGEIAALEEQIGGIDVAAPGGAEQVDALNVDLVAKQAELAALQ